MYIELLIILIAYNAHVSCATNRVICDHGVCHLEYAEWVVQVNSGALGAKQLARCMGLEFVAPLTVADNLYLLRESRNSKQRSTRTVVRCKRSPSVVWAEEQVPRFRAKRSELSYTDWNDPLYPEMWYITRSKENGGFDMNVVEAWELGYSGRGIVLTIMDDGIDYTHTDLRQNYDPQASYDLIDDDPNPMPNLNSTDNNRHGTRCAGQIAAQGNNSVCMVGIAYNARIGGIRMLDGHITDRLESDTLGFRNDYIHIYSGSWGPEDSGKQYEGPAPLAQTAFLKGIVLGRNGLGNIYVWASGNGGSVDSCASDGYASSMFTLSVSGVGEHNSRPWYLEQCSSTLTTTYSSGGHSEKMIATIDPNQKCTNKHTGTSASAPMAAGIVALLLEANPRLNWRDVQYITMLTSNPRPFADGNFTINAVGRAYSSFYGYGLMDAGKMVRLGELWRGVPAHHRCVSRVGIVKWRLNGSFDHTFALNFSGCNPVPRQDDQTYAAYAGNISDEGRPVLYLEHVQLHAELSYQRRGLLQITLISPSGTQTVLQPPRLQDKNSGDIGLQRWPLTTVQLWGEPARGTWLIRVDNQAVTSIPESSRPDVNTLSGFWRSVVLVVHGTDEFPIRLRPPLPERPPPSDWFAPFSKYVIDDAQWHKVYTCHIECAAGGCTGPAADQCLGGCRHFATESKQCVSTCPTGTTPYGALRITVFDQDDYSNPYPAYRNRIKPGRIRSSDVDSSDPTPATTTNVVCQPCWTLCAACVRPHTEYDCTACSNGRYLVPLLTTTTESRLPFQVETDLKRIHAIVPSVAGTCRVECPPGFYTNTSSNICNLCAEYCSECTGPHIHQCLMCDSGFRLVHGRCVDGNSVDGRCEAGQYLERSQCVNCSANCEPGGCLPGGRCSHCKSGFAFLFNSVCVKVCPSGWYAGSLLPQPFTVTTSDASSTRSPGLRQCEPCRPGCQSCDNFSVCHTCLPGLSLREGQCVVSGSQDLLCGPGCLSCYRNPNDCLTCLAPYVLVAQIVLSSKPYPMPQPNILTDDDGVCSAAAAVDDPSYVCVDQCPQGTFLVRHTQDSLCRACPVSCATCIDESRCIACRPPFYLDPQTSLCQLGRLCRQSEFFDPHTQECAPCDVTCGTCVGPRSTDCTSCRIHGAQPRCLSPSHTNVSTKRDVLLDRKVELDEVLATRGPCMPCCAYSIALLDRTPTDCMFCVAHRITCLSGTEINAGEGLLIEHMATPAEAIHTWLMNEPSRLVLMILCAALLIGAATYIIAHAIRVCRQRRDRHVNTTATGRRRRRRRVPNGRDNEDGAQVSLKLGDQRKDEELHLDRSYGAAPNNTTTFVGRTAMNDARSCFTPVNGKMSNTSNTDLDRRVLYTPMIPCNIENADYVDASDIAPPACTTHATGEYCTRSVPPSGNPSMHRLSSPYVPHK